jgi:hypothetical protein
LTTDRSVQKILSTWQQCSSRTRRSERPTRLTRAHESEADDGENHDDEVDLEGAPAVCDERAPQFHEEIEEKLDDEGDDEDQVERLQDGLLFIFGFVGMLQIHFSLGNAEATSKICRQLNMSKLGKANNHTPRNDQKSCWYLEMGRFVYDKGPSL